MSIWYTPNATKTLPFYALSRTHFICEIVLEKEYAETLFEHLSFPHLRSDIATERRLHLSLILSLIRFSEGKYDLIELSETKSKLIISIPVTLKFNTSDHEPSNQAHTLLLIDDSSITYFILQKLCAIHNIELDYAENLIDAQQFMKKDKLYTWIMVDLHLKNASGFDVVHQLKSNLTKDTFFVAISSDSLGQDVIHDNANGFDHFIQKPQNPVILNFWLNALNDMTYRRFYVHYRSHKNSFFKEFSQRLLYHHGLWI